MTTQLLPCPFCGGEAKAFTEYQPFEYVLLSDDDDHWYVVEAKDEESFFAQVNDPLGDPESIFDRVGGAPSLVKFRQYRID